MLASCICLVQAKLPEPARTQGRRRSGSPVPCERSQDSLAARARWRADAADDAGFGGDRLEAYLG